MVPKFKANMEPGCQEIWEPQATINHTAELLPPGCNADLILGQQLVRMGVQAK